MTQAPADDDWMESGEDIADGYDSSDEGSDNLSRLSTSYVEPDVICGTCQTVIVQNIDWDELHAVKCQVCGEWTPVSKPPPGKKFVRCFCKRLLIAGQRIDRIACRKCRRITLIPSPDPTQLMLPASTQMITSNEGYDGKFYGAQNPIVPARTSFTGQILSLLNAFAQAPGAASESNKRKREDVATDEFVFDYTEMKENTAKYQAIGGLPDDIPDPVVNIPKGNDMELDDYDQEWWD